ncbi:hypothetical protein B7463_g1673, partial [Scytalidium lignicola]
MGQNGLGSSIWAASNRNDVDFSRRPGDWSCSSCSFLNFRSRTNCYKCYTAKDGIRPDKINGGGQTTPIQIAAPPETVYQESIQDLDIVGQQEGIPTDSVAKEYTLDTRPYYVKFTNEGSGLSASCWAPRNRNREPPSGNRGKFEQDYTTAYKPSAASHSYPISAKKADLGLPYEVQHYILAMIQRILEEGCWDFASRWIPNILIENNWTCCEAVELSSWRRVLPTAPLPSRALVSVPNYSLEKALVDAVQIRNSAVHRHLCDNTELKRMLSHAQGLMSMFSDVTRQTKFHQLSVALVEWDDTSGDDLHAARSRLESVIQEVNEKPIDDMDWTPNTESLEQVAPGKEEVIKKSQAPAPSQLWRQNGRFGTEIMYLAEWIKIQPRGGAMEDLARGRRCALGESTRIQARPAGMEFRYETTWIWVLQCDSSSGSSYECGTVSGIEHDTATCPRGAKANTASIVTTFPTTTAHRYTPPPSVNTALSTVITDSYTVIITADEQTTTLTSIFASTFTSALPDRTPTTIPTSTSASHTSTSNKSQKSGVTLAAGAIVGIAVGPVLLIALGASIFFFLRKRSKQNKDAIELLSAGNDNIGADAPPPNGPVGGDQIHPYEFDVNEAKGARSQFRGPKVDTYEVPGTQDVARGEKKWKEQRAGVPEMGADELRSPRSPVPMYTEHVIPVELDGTGVARSVRR